MDLLIVGQKGTLGEEDVFIERKNNYYQTSCQCISYTAEVYELKQDDFLKELKKQSNFIEIIDLIQSKRDRFDHRIKKKE